MSEKLAKENRELFINSKTGSYVQWRTTQQKAYDFAHCDQLTSKELSDLTSAGMPTFIVDKISGSVDVLIYFLTANNPGIYVVGREGSDTDLASVHDALVEYCWDLSLGKSLHGQILRNSLTKSVGYWFVTIDPNADRGMGEVVLRSLNPWDVYVDPASTDILYRDAGYILIKKDFTRRQLKNKLPQFASKINKASGNDEHSTGYSDRDTTQSASIQPADITTSVDNRESDWIDYYERYEKYKAKFVTVTARTEPSQVEIDEIKKKVQTEVAFFEKKLVKELESQAIQLRDAFSRETISKERMNFELQKLQEDAKKAVKDYQVQVTNDAINSITTTQTSTVTEKEYIQLKDSEVFKDKIVNAVPYYKDRVRVIVSVGTDTFLYKNELPGGDYPIIPVPYGHTGTPYPMSAVQKAVGTQQEVNKAHQLMIHNASLGSSLRWKRKPGATTKDFPTQITMPGGIIDVLTGNLDDVKEILPAPLNSAFFQVAEKGEQIIEKLMGAKAILRGGKSSHETFRGYLAEEEASTRNVKAWMGNVVEPALEQVFKVFTSYSQATYQSYKIFRIINPDTGDVKKYELNIPIYPDLTRDIEKYHDYESTTFDIKVKPGSTLPVNRWAVLERYEKWFEIGIVDDIAFLAETDVKNKEELIKRKSIYAQLSQENEALKEALKQKEGTIETFTRELEHSGIKEKVKKAEVEIDKVVNKVKSEIIAKQMIHTGAMKLIEDKARQQEKPQLAKKK